MYSSVIHLIVDSLPAHPRASGVVGSFHSFGAHLDQTDVAVGDAVLLTLELVGEGHVIPISPPLVQGLSRALKYYDSKTDIVPDGSDRRVRFEYIVQALEAGEWEIPGQEFTYFDVKAGEYKTLRTEPLHLSVAPNTQVTHEHMVQDEPAQQDSVNELRPLHEHGPWYPEPDGSAMPWWLFWTAVALPLCYALFLCMRLWWRCYRERTETDRRARRAFTYARAALKRFEHAGTVHDIPALFVQLFVDRWRMKSHEITEQYVREQLISAGMPVEKQEEWDAFWRGIMHGAFAREQIPDTLNDELYTQAYVWIDTLKKWL